MGGGLYPRPGLRASRVLRYRARFRRVPRTVDMSTWSEPRVVVTGYDEMPKAERVDVLLARTAADIVLDVMRRRRRG